MIEHTLWSPPPADLELHSGELHLWRISCGEDDGAALDRLWPLLSIHEQGKAARFKQERHRRRYVRAHAGLRRVLSRYANVPPQVIEYRYGEAGKPSVEGGPQFNLTTSADLALAAVCLDHPVGVDCEHIRPRSNLDAVARRMFAPGEVARLKSVPPEERLTVFTRYWTSLEASVKADGRGLFRSRQTPPMPSLDIINFVPTRGYVAAVARTQLPSFSKWTTLSLD